MYIHKHKAKRLHLIYGNLSWNKKKKIAFMGYSFFIKGNRKTKTSKTETTSLAEHLVVLEPSLKEANII